MATVIADMLGKQSPSTMDFIRAYPRLRAKGQAMKRARRRVFERVGSERYSHPSSDGLDRKLAEYLPERDGVFVEAGGYDGYLGSNTYWFERFRGWTGVLIEPLPELAELAKRERPRSQVVQCALVPFDHREDYVDLRYGGMMSVVSGVWDGEEDDHARIGAHRERRETFELRVPARPLSDVLSGASITTIDLMSLDVEGYETAVLHGLDLARHKPRFLLVEMLREDRQRPEIEAILHGHYHHEAQLSGQDHLYRRA
jgi:FkbM family methyltransferase